MPREIIHDNTVHADSTNSDPKAISIGWGREGYVQLASVDLTVQDTSSTEYGWHVDLNRDMINKVIRTLRKARDQAYGADE